MISAAYYEKGPAAFLNQDAAVYEQASVDGVSIAMALVCDGIGGLQAGEYASTLVTGTAKEWFYSEALWLYHKRAGWRERRNSVLRMMSGCADHMRRYGAEKQIELGTTVTMLLVRNRKYEIFHMGDSRCYLISRGRCIRLTKDDVTDRGCLSKCLGSGRRKNCQTLRGKMKKESALLLCTDGFRRRLADQEMAEAFAAGGIHTEAQLEKRLKKAGEEAIRRGEKDNMTAVCIVQKQNGGVSVWRK